MKTGKYGIDFFSMVVGIDILDRNINVQYAMCKELGGE